MKSWRRARGIFICAKHCGRRVCAHEEDAVRDEQRTQRDVRSWSMRVCLPAILTARPSMKWVVRRGAICKGGGHKRTAYLPCGCNKVPRIGLGIKAVFKASAARNTMVHY
eukprot:6480894-Pyramimonas_sp.AAC.1